MLNPMVAFEKNLFPNVGYEWMGYHHFVETGKKKIQLGFLTGYSPPLSSEKPASARGDCQMAGLKDFVELAAVNFAARLDVGFADNRYIEAAADHIVDLEAAQLMASDYACLAVLNAGPMVVAFVAPDSVRLVLDSAGVAG